MTTAAGSPPPATRRPRRKAPAGARIARGARKGQAARLIAAEHQLQISVAEYLDLALPPDAVWTSVDMAIAAGKFGNAFRRGLKPGWPDTQVIWRGRFIAIELKAEDGAVDDRQRVTSVAIERAGGWWHEARDVETVERILRRHGLPLRASVADFRATRAPR